MNNIFKVITPDGRALWFGFTRHDGDKELFEANESARLYKDGEVIADNFDVFPLEPDVKSAWIPVADGIPPMKDMSRGVSARVLITDGEDQVTGRVLYFLAAPDRAPEWIYPSDWLSGPATHWQPLPALP